MTYYHFCLIFQSELYDYRKLGDMIISMNREHSRGVALFGKAADAVYATLDKKKEEIWRRMHSDSRLSRGHVALDSRAMAQSDKDIKELLLTCAKRSCDPSLRRFAEEFDWHVDVVDQVVEKEKAKPPLSQINRKDVSGKERQRVNKGASIFWISTVSNQCFVIVGWLVLNLAALPSPVGL
jgi:hypothetical protein